MRVEIFRNLLDRNDRAAEANRRLFAGGGILVVNLMGSPGAGKTAVIEATLAAFGRRMAVIEGDLATSRDTERLAALGAAVCQINTYGGCHLDAPLVAGVLDGLDWRTRELLMVENVGNLVCPAEFDLGQDLRVVVISTPEGSDKIAKYPPIFHRADAVILNKTDLLPHLPFALEALRQDLRQLNPHAPLFPLSALRGDGVQAWTGWLEERVRAKRGRQLTPPAAERD